MIAKAARLKTTLIAAGLLAAFAGASRAAEIKENWDKNCASCHGKDGKGETKAGKKAGVKDQTDPKYQASLTDDKMFQAVKEGLKEDGKEKMKPSRDKLTD